MTLITVAPRFVAAPWEWSRERLGARTFVSRDGGLLPDSAVLAAYQAKWPHRYVVWDSVIQQWEVRHINPLTGHDESYEHLFYWDCAPKEEKPATQVEIADAVHDYLGGRITQRDAGLHELYRPFDMEFVSERIRQSYEWQKLRGKDRQKSVVTDRNRAVARARTRQAAEEFAYFFKSERRWLPALAAMHDGAHPNVAALARIPIAPGLPGVESPNLRPKEGICLSSAA